MTKKYKRTWKCPECPFTAEMSYDDIAEVGNPICIDCDMEMELTEEVELAEIPEIWSCPKCHKKEEWTINDWKVKVYHRDPYCRDCNCYMIETGK